MLCSIVMNGFWRHLDCKERAVSSGKSDLKCLSGELPTCDDGHFNNGFQMSQELGHLFQFSGHFRVVAASKASDDC